MKRTFIALLTALGVLAVIGGALYLYLTSSGFIRGRVEATLGEWFRGPVQVGSATFSPGKELSVRDLRIRDLEGKEVVSAGDLRVVLTGELLRPVARRAEIRGLSVAARRDRHGDWNVTGLLAPRDLSRDASRFPREGVVIRGMAVSIGREGAEPFTVQGIDADLRRASSGAIEGTGTILDPDLGRVGIQGEYEPGAGTTKVRFESESIRLSDATTAKIPGIGEGLAELGRIDFEGSARVDLSMTPDGVVRWSATARSRSSRMRLKVFPFTVDRITGDLDTRKRQIRVHNLRGSCHGGTVTGEISIGSSSLVGRAEGFGLRLESMRNEAPEFADDLKGILSIRLILQPDASEIGHGNLSLREANLSTTPVFLSVFNVLNIRLPRDTVFTEADGRFFLGPARATFTEFTLIGTDVALYGEGDVDYEGKIQGRFIPRIGSKFEVVPVVGPLVQEVVQKVRSATVQVRVVGTVLEAKALVVPMGRVTDGLRRFWDRVLGGKSPR